MDELLERRRFGHRPVVVLVIVALMLATLGPVRAGELEVLREDVRSDAERDFDLEGKGSSDNCRRVQNDDPWNKEENPWDEFLGSAMTSLGGMIVLSPFWFPRAVTNDNGEEGYFASYPYRNGPGYMMIDEWIGEPYTWSARVRSDYAENFDGLSRVGGHLLVSSASRWELDTEMNYLQERLPGHTRDHLWLGDCNVQYRFAQSERVQFRAGLGFNWLDDPANTDFGFNFTYGFDVFPRKPFVLSTELDWGTLGSAEAFHFRTTAGALVGGFETYVGYEYRDIDRFHFNGLVAGVRVWF